jgi:hypothetical protein
MQHIRHWMRLVEIADDDPVAQMRIVRQMMELLNSDTRIDSAQAEQSIAALQGQIPEDYRHAPGILWRSAGIALDDAKRLLASGAVVSMTRRFASWTADRSGAAQFLAADPDHPTALYRAAIAPQAVVFNAATAPAAYQNFVPALVGEVIVEMSQRLATVSQANMAGLAVTDEQYTALTGQQIKPNVYGHILRFAGGKIARVEPGPGYKVFPSR